MTAPVDEEPTTRERTGRNLGPAPRGVENVQLTPKKILALVLGVGLPVVVAAGWVLGQRGATGGGAADGSGAMGNAPREQVPTPAARYDVYSDDAPLVVPMASTGAAPGPTTTAAGPKATRAPRPHPTSTPTVLPEDQTPSPEPSPSDPEPEPTPEPSTGSPDKTG
ncbi:hypothetical protein [Asanoa siamensis]|uniref:Uncharacterized protein n=1 Tax=Asanoa siamensis TaxID=926357 RepID=A0ABQ4CHG6_9ACTN|nr:hypothetical protein [Asanoa siamensis]GIF70725.1 hypothetical protein Asi02nite_02430 [Asanoa siamensis]